MGKWWICWSSRFVEGIQRHGPALLLFAVLSILLTWPVVLTPSSHLENEGDAVLNAWTLGWDAAHLLRPAQLPHAPNFYPYPYTLYFSEHLLGAALLVAPIVWLTGNPVLAYNLLFLSAFALSAIGTYALVLWLTGDRMAAVLSGLLFGSMTLRFGPSPQLQVLLNFGIPLAVLFLLRLLRTGSIRDLVGLVLASLGQFLISLYHGLFLAVGLLGIGVEQAIRHPQARRPAILGKAVFAILLTGALYLPVAWPYLEARRWVGARGLGEQALFGLLSFLLVPHRHLYATLPPFREIHRYVHVETLFPGIVPLALAVYGIWHSRSPWRRPFALLAVLGTVFAMGPAPRLRLEDPPLFPAMPYLLLWQFFPGFQAIRVPARIFVLAQLGLSVLAGLGWHAWRPRRALRGWAFALALALGILEAYRGPFPRHPAPRPIPDLDRRLAGSALPQPFLEFPTIRTLDILSDPETMRRLTHAQFATLYRGQPTPIGYSGFFPPLFWEVADRLLVFPSRESLAFFADLGVKAIVVRTEGWDEEEQRAFTARWALFRDRFQEAVRTPAGTLYFLKESTRPGSGAVEILGMPEGDRVWLFLQLPQTAWPWRVTLTPSRYRLVLTAPEVPEASPVILQGELPLALPAYLEALPIGWVPQPQEASALQVEGQVEPGEKGRMHLPPPQPVRLRSTIPLRGPAPKPSGVWRMPRLEFENGLALDALALSGESFCPGEALELTMFWSVWDAQAFHAQDQVPVVFLHLHDHAGRMAAGRDLPVDFGNKPFRTWAQGESILQSYRLMLPADLPPGSATIVVGLYPLGRPDPASRWPIRSARASLWEHAAAAVATIEIRPTPCWVQGDS